jgi:hypothetical protein
MDDPKIRGMAAKVLKGNLANIAMKVEAGKTLTKGDRELLEGVATIPEPSKETNKATMRELEYLTGMDHRTIKHRLTGVRFEPGPRGSRIYDTQHALRAIFLGERAQKAMSMEEARLFQTEEDGKLKRVCREEKERTRIPLEIVKEVNDAVMFEVAAKIKAAAKTKGLGEKWANEILETLRGIPEGLKW